MHAERTSMKTTSLPPQENLAIHNEFSKYYKSKHFRYNIDIVPNCLKRKKIAPGVTQGAQSKDTRKVSWECILSRSSEYGMSSVLLAPVAAKSADYMSLGRVSPFKINWRVIIGVCLAFIIVLVYYLLTPSGMEFRGYLEWEGKTEGIFYREEVPPSGGRFTVLFLHGQTFSSQTWDDLDTLKLLRSQDYRVVAVDLPGYVKSKDAEVPRTSDERAEFLNKFVEKLKIERPVIISPSMSGSYALPFIFQGDQERNLRGHVPVAPVATENYREDDYKSLELPTLIVYGENDSTLGVSSLRRLRNIPGSVIHVMKGAGHACYMSNPKEFHENLLSFLSKL